MNVDKKKEAAKRLLKAEAHTIRASESLVKAQALLSVIVGVDQAVKLLQNTRLETKKLQFAIQKVGEKGDVEIDETSANFITKQAQLKIDAIKKLGKYTVHLTSVGNPDFGQYAPISESETVGADTLKALWKKCEKYMEKWNMGGGNWPNPMVKEDGNPIGHFSYNGRLWSKHKTANPSPTGTTEILY